MVKEGVLGSKCWRCGLIVVMGYTSMGIVVMDEVDIQVVRYSLLPSLLQNCLLTSLTSSLFFTWSLRNERGWEIGDDETMECPLSLLLQKRLAVEGPHRTCLCPVPH